MFQTFTAQSAPEQGPPRLAALRAEMSSEKIDGFLVPRADAFQGEYVADCDARLGWLTGFTGSAGVSGTSSAIAARVSLTPEADPDAETTVFRNEWRCQWNAADSEIAQLANYRDDEVVALARKGGDWVILLLSPEGALLTL